jgi:tRNA threonylcarbamoyladenosine biosynthesis protein TsaB
MSDRLVFALDLSSPRGVMAVVRGQEVLFEATFQSERSHNAQVFAPLKQALAVIGEAPAMMAVGTGPGSYTGVRISIAAAQGVALSRGWPLIGWPSIATLAKPSYHVLGDARRGLFYTVQVQQGRVVGVPEILSAEAARAQVEAGGDWGTFDATAPLELPHLWFGQPDMVELGRKVSQLAESELAELTCQRLEPVYLQDAFITVAKKAGKKVPAGR